MTRGIGETICCCPVHASNVVHHIPPKPLYTSMGRLWHVARDVVQRAGRTGFCGCRVQEGDHRQVSAVAEILYMASQSRARALLRISHKLARLQVGWYRARAQGIERKGCFFSCLPCLLIPHLPPRRCSTSLEAGGSFRGLVTAPRWAKVSERYRRRWQAERGANTWRRGAVLGRVEGLVKELTGMPPRRACILLQYSKICRGNVHSPLSKRSDWKLRRGGAKKGDMLSASAS